MIKAKINHCRSLEEFYKEIRQQQEQAHGEAYCLQHDVIKKYLKSEDTYKELGTNQGATAAAALLVHPKRVELVDHKMDNFREVQPLFESYSKEHNIELILYECDTISKRCISDVDFLLVDSCHKPHHLRNELALHGSSVKKYMLFHDTTKPTEALYHVLEDFCKLNPWKIMERNTESVGYTLLKRTQ